MIISFGLTVLTQSCEKSNGDPLNNHAVPEELVQNEVDNLLFLREEEKLARDVYTYAFDLYGEVIFDNISNSEQKHMNLVLTVLDKYGISDPAEGLGMGDFSNPIIQDLYDQLILRCELSDLESFVVGAEIEDLDISDLRTMASESTNTDILDLVQKLECGSRNHMRAFNGKLEDLAATYEPIYLSSEEFEEILLQNHEHCGS